MNFLEDEASREEPPGAGHETVNQEFVLFKPERTVNESSRGNAKSTKFKLITDIPDNEEVNVRVTMDPLTSGSLMRILTPFDPDKGARISGTDFDYAARVEAAKEHQQSPDQSKKIDKNTGLHALVIECKVNGLIKDPQSRNWTLPTDSPLNDIRLILAFPNGIVLEAKPIPAAIKTNPTIYFPYFHPIDTGPLATKTGFDIVGSSTLAEGLSVAVPNNLNTLNQIQANFLKLPSKQAVKSA